MRSDCPLETTHTTYNTAEKQKLREKKHKATVARAQYIRDSGYELIAISGCEWDDMQNNDPVVREYVRKFKSTYLHKQQLSPKDAFFGGR